MQQLAHIALVVADYDAAIAYYTQVLGFTLLADTDLGGGKRWVLVQPSGGGTALLLARALNDVQRAAIGNQTGGRVFLFLQTDDFARDHALYVARGVQFVRPISHETYGTVAVFADLYGNLWDLIQYR